MKFLWFLLCFCSLASVFSSTAMAYEAISVTPRMPYEAIGIDSRIATTRSYLGELVGDPHLYEFVLGESENLSLLVRQGTDEFLPLSVIVVKARDNDRGVREISRITGQDASLWKREYDKVLGVPLLNGERFTAELEAGVYRVEISTPENRGKYLLTIGDAASDSGYFSSIPAIYQTQRFFGYSPFRIMYSNYIYYPLGSSIFVMLIFFTWRHRQKISHA